MKLINDIVTQAFYFIYYLLEKCVALFKRKKKIIIKISLLRHKVNLCPITNQNCDFKLEVTISLVFRDCVYYVCIKGCALDISFCHNIIIALQRLNDLGSKYKMHVTLFFFFFFFFSDNKR